MKQRALYLIVAFVMAGLTWLFVGGVIENTGWMLIAGNFLLALITGLASLIFLLLAAEVETPEGILKDSAWCEFLFREHPERRLREWAKSMRYFRFVRAFGGRLGDEGECLMVAFKTQSPKEVEQILAMLGVSERTALESSSPVLVLVNGVKVLSNRTYERLELSISDQEDPYAVTQAAVDSARAIEVYLERAAGRIIDPPRNDKHCVCPKFYPSFWKDPLPVSREPLPEPDIQTTSERRRNQALLLAALGLAFLFLAAGAWYELSDERLLLPLPGNFVFAYLRDIGGAQLAIGAFLIPGLLLLAQAQRILTNLKREARRRRRRNRSRPAMR